MRSTTASTIVLALILLAGLVRAQGTPPATPLTLVSPEGQRAVPTVTLSGQELIALDAVAALFGVTVREDALAGGFTVTYEGETIVASADQPMASVSGRVVALPSPVVRAGDRALVPLEFLSRALAPVYDRTIELRRASRLLIVGDVTVPRVRARIDAPGPPTRASVEVTPATPVTVMTDGGRVLLRVEADALDLALPASGGGLVDQIRSGDQPETVAVVLDPRAGAPRVVQTTADNVTRVLIEVMPADAPAAAAPPAAAPAPLPAAPVVTSPRTTLETIVLDPGHGGEDVGVRGVNGSEEKAITLDVAERLRGLIEARLGIRVILTRDADRLVSPDERASAANNSKADLFLSLHANAAPAPSVAGAEVYHLRLDREGENARLAAEAEAMVLPVLGGATRELEVIQWDLAQARHVEASSVLAAIIEEELRRRVTMSTRPRQQAPLRVLLGANMPAALIEIAYLTNPEQEKVAGSEAYQSLIAQALYDAIVRFRGYLDSRGPQ